jgi:hypothetical protein
LHFNPGKSFPSNSATMLAPLVDNGFAGRALLQAAANALRSAISASLRSRAVGGGAFFSASSDLGWGVWPEYWL